MLIAICALNHDQTQDLMCHIQNWLSGNKRCSIITCFTDLNKLVLHSTYYGEPDIIFYHIMDGQELIVNNLLMLRKVCPASEIILISANAKNAIVGYRIGAMWFLEIPFSSLEIRAALELAVHHFLLKQRNRFCLNSEGEEIAIPYGDILYFESIKHYVYAITSDGSYRFRENIGVLNTCLPATLFFRCHRCYIVNLAHIDKINANTIYLTASKEIPLSKSYRESIVRTYRLYVKTNNKEAL